MMLIALPETTPPPHPIVDFLYTLDNMVPGDPALSISTNGFITVTPTETGYMYSQ